MFLKRLFSHSLIYALGPQIPRIAAIFVLPLITQHLTSKDYGVYGVLTSYVGILTGMADLGFAVTMVNSFYKYPKKWPIIWRQLHFYLIAWSILYSILMAIMLNFVIPKSEEGQLLNIMALVCLPSLFFNSTIVIGSRYYQFAQKPLYIGMTSALVGIIAIFLTHAKGNIQYQLFRIVKVEPIPQHIQQIKICFSILLPMPRLWIVLHFKKPEKHSFWKLLLS